MNVQGALTQIWHGVPRLFWRRIGPSAFVVEKMPRPPLTLSLLVGSALAASVALWTPGLRVVDGDTVDHGWFRYRIAGLDAPETYRAKCAAERAAGRRATERLRSLVAASGDAWRLEPVRGERDPYRRRVARLELGPAAVDAAGVLITEGLARPYAGGARRGWCGEE